MRANTFVHAGIRNIGDSQDSGTFYEGTVRDCVMWLATQLGTIVMAQRINIAIARTRAEVERGLHSKFAGHQKVDVTMTQMLESVFADMGVDEDDSPAEREMQQVETSRDPLDTYKGV